MTTHYPGCAKCLKNAVPNVFTIHSVVHCQHLVGKNSLIACISLYILSIITTVNKIKAQARMINYSQSSVLRMMKILNVC